ncbi:MAG: family 20 glycosylhydrolase, partial [Lentisphaeria bacterium]
MKKVILMLILLAGVAFGQAPLIPMPQEVKWDKGVMNLSSARIMAPTSLSNEAKFLQSYLTSEKIRSSMVNDTTKANIILSLGKVESPNKIKGAYTLNVTNNQVKIVANEAAGVFWAIQTLRQMISNKKIPTATIKDWPAYEIRGFMHDVGRNFISVGVLKEHLELMALYKLNVFHFHFTEYHGWRLESKIYPQLNAPEHTSRKPGKFYTQEQFKDLIKFCQERHITIIPEFDVPGHSTAFRSAMGIKQMKDPRASKVLAELINELCTLAPPEVMPYIHVGSDEVRNADERVDAKTFFAPICEAIRKNKREVLGWVAGMLIHADKNIIQQVWAPHSPAAGIPWIDSRTNYINHLDNFMAAQRMLFQKPGWNTKNDKLLGGIICSWPDLPVEADRGVFVQNPIFICTVGYGETMWRGRQNNELSGWANIPPTGALYEEFLNFENRMLSHRDRYFRNKEFNYVRQANIPWKIIHFATNDKNFPVEAAIKDEYEVGGKKVSWLDQTYYGATITL